MDYTFFSAAELSEAVANKFITREEARAIYWSQAPALQRQASVTPPSITTGTDSSN